MIGKLLFRLARTGPLGSAVRFGFAHLSGLLPVQRVCETGDIVAFHHPRPAWDRHVLFMPKEPIPSLGSVRPEQVPLVRRLVELALEVAARERFDRDGFALLANGGAYQDVGQLHFHLASRAREAWYECPDRPAGPALLEADALTAHRHPRPRRAVHIVMLPPRGPLAPAAPGLGEAFIDAVIIATQRLIVRLDLEVGGYTLAIGAPPVGRHRGLASTSSPAPIAIPVGRSARTILARRVVVRTEEGVRRERWFGRALRAVPEFVEYADRLLGRADGTAC